MVARMFFYGTLKKGYYNNARLGLDDPKVAEFVGPAQLYGYGIATIGLPYAVRSEDHFIIGEVWDVYDPDVADSIRRMEMGAGYDELEVTVYSTVLDESYTAMFYPARRTVEDTCLSSVYDNPDHLA